VCFIRILFETQISVEFSLIKYLNPNKNKSYTKPKLTVAWYVIPFSLVHSFKYVEVPKPSGFLQQVRPKRQSLSTNSVTLHMTVIVIFTAEMTSFDYTQLLTCGVNSQYDVKNSRAIPVVYCAEWFWNSIEWIWNTCFVWRMGMKYLRYMCCVRGQNCKTFWTSWQLTSVTARQTEGVRKGRNCCFQLLKPTGLLMYQGVQHSTILRSAHIIFVCFVFIWEQTATFAVYNANWLVFITEIESVYSAVRTGSLNKAVCASSIEG
jgi:hypothetical protein